LFGLVVRFDLTPGSGEVFDALASEAVALIREAEPGTLIYACHAVEGDADARVFYELYRDKDAFQDHEGQDHVRRFHEKKAQYLAGEPRVEFLSLQLGKGTPAPGP